MVPRRDLKTSELEAVIAYLRSLPAAETEPIPVDDNLRFAGDPELGHETFGIYCAPCHGPNGEGYAVGGSGPGIGLPGFLAVASDDFILQTVKHGRAGTSMRPFVGARGLANLAESDVHDVNAHLRSHDVAASTQVVVDGEASFNRNCAVCHQPGGAGQAGLAPSIGNGDFLALASDNFIVKTVRTGRVGTAMAARQDLTDRELSAIITYLRSQSSSKREPIPVDESIRFTGDAAKGRENFTTYCSPCHGPNGEGYRMGGTGPGIGSPGFLNTVSDDYIFQTVKHGRTGTPMRSFIGSRGLANLQEQDVRDVVVYLRSRSM